MTDPDRAPEPVAEAAEAAYQQIFRVYQLAATQGIREGMEAAAKICEAVAATTRNKPEGVFPADIAAVATADFLRDKIREFALELPDPPPLQNATPTEEE